MSEWKIMTTKTAYGVDSNEKYVSGWLEDRNREIRGNQRSGNKKYPHK